MSATRERRTFTCDECGTSGGSHWMETHDCYEVQRVAEFGGRCEDFPCCGHLNGECMPSERFTKEYWQERYDRLDPDERFEVDAYGWPDEY